MIFPIFASVIRRVQPMPAIGDVFWQLMCAKCIEYQGKTIMMFVLVELLLMPNFAGCCGVFSERVEARQMYEFVVRGTAFLYHQVRCMMAILFQIGQGRAEPSIIDAMLDMTQTPKKPSYEMALEVPLVLHECGFDSTTVRFARKSPVALFGHLEIKPEALRQDAQATVYRHFVDLWTDQMSRVVTIESLLAEFEKYVDDDRVVEMSPAMMSGTSISRLDLETASE